MPNPPQRQPPRPPQPPQPPPPNSLPPSLLERYFAEHEFSTPLLACCSDVEPLTVRELLQIAAQGPEASRSLFDDISLGYQDPRGSPQLREAIAREHGGGSGGGSRRRGTSSIGADDVLVAALQELAYLLQRAVLQGEKKNNPPRPVLFSGLKLSKKRN